jgi:hypothetical protein
MHLELWGCILGRERKTLKESSRYLGGDCHRESKGRKSACNQHGKVKGTWRIAGVVVRHRRGSEAVEAVQVLGAPPSLLFNVSRARLPGRACWPHLTALELQPRRPGGACVHPYVVDVFEMPLPCVTVRQSL